MLMLNGNELTASKESTEAVVLAVGSGTLDRQAWTEWVKEQIKPLGWGCRPMAIRWRLHRAIPASFLPELALAV
jgi:hypothetical protein